MDPKTNSLYYGDNLRILREHIPSNFVDMVYLDPPFNSKRDYNVIFNEEGDKESEAQIEAFTDTWRWGKVAEKTYSDIVANAPVNVAKAIDAIIKFLGHNDVTAYLAMMTPRLLELHRILVPAGSIYLHCDPTASHYLKVIMDQIFGKENFRNEIIWHYRKWPSGHKQFQRNHDVLLFYSKTDAENRVFNIQYMERSASTLKRFGMSKIVSGYDTKGQRLPSKVEEEQSPGVPQDDVWDIGRVPPIKQLFPTQKPEKLLERVIKASSNPGDLVLDPFCGCGTAIVEAQRLKRKWVGIDITHLAIGLVKKRLKDMFPGISYEIVGEPEDLSGAKELARSSKLQFQWWVVDLVGGRPANGKKAGADQGIDGVIPFIEGKGGMKRILISVKGGGVTVSQVRDLIGVVQREKAAIGVFVTLERPTEPMLKEAAITGYYHSDSWGKDFPKIQVLTIEDLLNGKRIEMPPQVEPYKNSELAKQDANTQELF